ncbi:MAG: amidohydrolase family protein [Abditibacteriales bacterium]|nr:amidohydrolase family protein [Abditibacteriales bacterium]
MMVNGQNVLRLASCVFVCLFIPSPLYPSASSQAAPSEPVTAIVGGEVWTVTKDVIPGGTVIIKGTKIDKVGKDLPIPPGAQVIDAKGKVVMPGFVAVQVTGGLVSSGQGQIKDALDPFNLSVSLALASGVTTVGTTGGGGGPFGGGEQPQTPAPLSSNNAVLKMTEGDISAMLVKEPALSTFAVSDGLGGFRRFGGFGGGGGSAGMSAKWNFREQLRKAKEFQQKYEQYEADKKAGKSVTEPRPPAEVSPVLPLIRKERVLRVTASSVSEIRWALKLVDDFGIRVVITPATEAWLIAEEIAKRDVMLIINPRDRDRPDERSNQPSGANPDAPGILQKAGVKFAVLPPTTSFSTGGMLGRDMLTYPLEAAFAMRGGADAHTALASITIVPAQILGVADRVGSLEEGKDADIVILDGDPLDYRTLVEKTFVNGKLLYDKDHSSFFAHVKRGS